LAVSQLIAQDNASGFWRPFGCVEDLDIDFETKDRPALVTMLLASCGVPREADFWWSQTVSTRIVALVRLLAVTDSIDQLKLLARCRQPLCAEQFELDLPMAMLQNSVPDGQPVEIVLNSGRRISLRRPNGRDLHKWNTLKLETRSAAVDVMLKSLAVEGQATCDDEPVLAKALSELDPLVAFTVSCVCPVCSLDNDVRIDLEEIVLARLKKTQRALLDEIHTLASQYGWTEAQVLAIPSHRRAHYASMIQDGR